MNNRRKLIISLGAVAFTASLASFAQQQNKVWRVGLLAQPNRATALDPLYSGAFPLGMRDLGYVEGKNLVIEWRFADGDTKRLPSLAAELVQLNVDVLVAAGHDAALAAQKATATIPIVMTTALDPIGAGLVKSLARPGGNITGIVNLSGDLGPKRLEILVTMVHMLSRVAVLHSPNNPSIVEDLERIKGAGTKLGVTILPLAARTPQEIDNAFSEMHRRSAGALIVFLQPLFQQQKKQIAELAVKHKLPSTTGDQLYAEAGCLMSYGANLGGMYRHAATYVDKIFKGARPGDLPVEQSTRFELVINRKTAKALGLTIPKSLLISADRVIE